MNNLEIQFNKTIIAQVKALNFQVDQLGTILFILFSLYEGHLDLLDEFDDYNLQKRAILLYKELELRGLVEQIDDPETGQPHFAITTEGSELVELLKTEFTDVSKKEIGSADMLLASGSIAETLSDENPDTWIDEWIELFPRGIRTFGKLVRSDKPSCLRKMKIFMHEYGYNKDTILKATKAYLDVKAQENYVATRCAVYFIYRVETSIKDKVSDLASWCDQVLHEEEQPNSGENNMDIMV